MKRSIELPYINVRDLVLFPNMTQGLYIGRSQTIEAIQYSLKNSHKRILVLAQRRCQDNNPKGIQDMYSMGTVCSVEGSVLLRDHTMLARFAGERLFKVDRIFTKEGVRFAAGKYVNEKSKSRSLSEDEKFSLIELLVRAKPRASFDEDATWFSGLKNSKRAHQLSEIILTHLNYRGTVVPREKKKAPPFRAESRLINSRVQLQQQILQEVKAENRLRLLRDYLKLEIANLPV